MNTDSADAGGGGAGGGWGQTGVGRAGGSAAGWRGGTASAESVPGDALPAAVINLRNHFQATPLHRAAAKGHAEVGGAADVGEGWWVLECSLGYLMPCLFVEYCVLQVG